MKLAANDEHQAASIARLAITQTGDLIYIESVYHIKHEKAWEGPRQSSRIC